MPDDTQIGSPRLGDVEEELKITMGSIRLAASSNGLGEFTKEDEEPSSGCNPIPNTKTRACR